MAEASTEAGKPIAVRDILLAVSEVNQMMAAFVQQNDTAWVDGRLTKALAALDDLLADLGGDLQNVSDGYHTFRELYEHRISLFIALTYVMGNGYQGQTKIWRSRLHSDGSSLEGWFVMGIGFLAGRQITYHLPMDRWDEVDFRNMETLERAPNFDGHSSADVLVRLKEIYT